MRHATAFSLIIANAASAQLINGSFELAGAPSLEGWEWTCGDPGQPNTAAPGSGLWCVTKEPGHAKGCFPSYIFQQLPDLVDGQLVTVTGSSHGLYRFFGVLDQLQFRMLAAACVSFLIVVVMGKRTIRWLRAKKIGDTGATDVAALAEHAGAKKNVPTMGGILIAGAILGSVFLLCV